MLSVDKRFVCKSTNIQSHQKRLVSVRAFDNKNVNNMINRVVEIVPVTRNRLHTCIQNQSAVIKCTSLHNMQVELLEVHTLILRIQNELRELNQDTLDSYCEELPDADECRIYDV